MTLSMFFRNDLKKLNYMCQLLYKLRERERERDTQTETETETETERERDGSNYDQKFYEGNFMLFWAYFQIFGYLIIPH